MSRTTHSNRNLAARMGRWSAAHWKTATFGWLAFVLVAFGLGGMVGTKTIDPNTSGPGESGRMDRILEAGFKQPAGESVLIQSRSLRRPIPPSRRRSRTSSRASRSWRSSRTSARRSTRRTRARSRRTGAALVEFEIRGDTDEAADKIDRSSTAVDEAEGPPAALHRRVRRRQRGQRSTPYAEDLGKAGLSRFRSR